jgi:hypothetical protein
MSVHVELHHHKPDVDTVEVFDDSELPPEIGGRYCYHVAAGGSLVILVDERGESRVDRVFSPTAWRSAHGDVWRKGMLLH